MSCPKDPIGRRLDGRVYLVTGANSGIGKATAQALAGKGARVLLHGRREASLKAARDEIAQATGNQDLEIRVADLADQQAIREMASGIRDAHGRLDALVNNAGAVLADHRTTDGGLEMQFAVNHLGPFLLTHELLDLLQATAEEHGEARVVSVASEAHWNAKRVPDGFQVDEEDYGAFSVYSQTKLYNILFTRVLARRLEGSGVSARCLHPGVIGSRFGSDGPWYVHAFMAVARPFLKGPEKGSRTSRYLAAAEEVEPSSTTYHKACRPAQVSKLARDDGLARELWQVSEKLTGATTWPRP